MPGTVELIGKAVTEFTSGDEGRLPQTVIDQGLLLALDRGGQPRRPDRPLTPAVGRHRSVTAPAKR